MKNIFFILFFLFSYNVLFGQEQAFAKIHAEVVEVLAVYKISKSEKNLDRFLITGEYNSTFSVNLPNETIKLKNKKEDVMEVSNWNYDISSGKLNGEAIVKIDATLDDTNSNSGEYYGTYDITFSYN